MHDTEFVRTAAIIVLAGLLGAAAVVRLAGGILPWRVLERAEWRVLGKLLGIVILGFLVLLRWINKDLAPEMFIYGRF
jgi:hypothetical protein